MNGRDDIEMLAAEYVLGTLEAAERAAVAARRQREADLDAAIGQWEARMSPLLDTVSDAVPRQDLLDDIQDRIAAGGSANGAAAGAVVDIAAMQSRVARWRNVAMAASALAAGLACFVVYSEVLAPPPDQHFVAVFQDGDAPPRFVMSINLESRELTVRPVAANLPQGKTFQLWIKAEPLGPSPRSLGLLQKPGQQTRKELRQFDPKLLQNATFGISVEPEGGSPTGKPSPGALHGKLIPATF